MQKAIVEMPEIKLVGICVRTNNTQEADKIKGKIFPCIQKYFHGALLKKLRIEKSLVQHSVRIPNTKATTLDPTPT